MHCRYTWLVVAAEFALPYRRTRPVGARNSKTCQSVKFTRVLPRLWEIARIDVSASRIGKLRPPPQPFPLTPSHLTITITITSK